MVFKTPAGLAHSAIRDFLRQTLPDYIDPCCVRRDERIPLDAQWKSRPGSASGAGTRDRIPGRGFAASILRLRVASRRSWQDS